MSPVGASSASKLAVRPTDVRTAAGSTRTWTQEYRSELLDDDAIHGALEQSGLSLDQRLDNGRKWLQARRASGPDPDC